MGKILVKELPNFINVEILSQFLVSEKEVREGSNKMFIRMKLSDSSGNITANIWNNIDHYVTAFEVGDVVKVKAMVISYKGQIQLTIRQLKKADEGEYDLSDFINTSKKDINKLSEEFFSYIDSISDEFIKKLLKKIFEDMDFYNRFAKAPAAKTWHHNYAHGLLEHTVGVAKVCDFAAKNYSVNRDLLIAGALLHDMGKIFEYEMKTAIDFTVMGRLIGHINLADNYVCNKAAEINMFPEETLMKIRHLILSHHGEYEKASARLPQTVEAIVLHFADNLDAQTTGVLQLVESAQTNDSDWTEYDRLNNRYYYLR